MNTKHTHRTIISLALVSLFMLSGFGVVQNTLHAADNNTEYVQLTPLPGTSLSNDCVASSAEGATDSQNKCKTNFQTYLPAMFNLAIGLAVALAFIMISYGGFTLMTTDSILKKTEGRAKVWEAIKGLLLVIAAYTILYTINPQILSFNLNPPQPDLKNFQTGTIPFTGDGAGSGSGKTVDYQKLDAAKLLDSQTTRDLLREGSGGKIDAYAGPCTTSGVSTGCVNLNNLPVSARDGLNSLQKNCQCTISITGGTEGGHSAHGPDLPVVDLSATSDPKMNNWITSNGTVQQTKLGPLYTVQKGGVTATFLHESNPDHWHVTYK